MTLTVQSEVNKKYEASFPTGYYTVESLAEAIKDAFSKHKIEIITEVYRPTGVLYLENPNPLRYSMNISEELAKLVPFDIEQSI